MKAGANRRMATLAGRMATVVAVAVGATAYVHHQSVPTPPRSDALGATAATVAPLDHVVIVVMENYPYSQVIGSASAPYINSLANANTLETNYHGVAHPSLPNYFAMTGGSTFGHTTDCSPNSCPVNATSIVDGIEKSGRTWMSYQEGMPAPCTLSQSGSYYPKHNPYVYYNDVRTNATRCKAHDVPYPGSLPATLPSYTEITPNICNDMHNCGVAAGDKWLSQNVPAILANPSFASTHSALVIVWDEGNNDCCNHVAFVAAGPAIKKAYRGSTSYNHYAFLHTIEASWGIAPLGSSGTAPTMGDMFA